MANLILYIDDLQLPITMDQLKEITTPNETSTTTLDGTFYTDFVNNRRSWQVHWPELSAQDYDALRAKCDGQYRHSRFIMLRIDHYSINVPAKLSWSDRNIRWAGSKVVDFVITLTEQYAVS